MRGYIRASRILIAAVLALVVWSDLPMQSTATGPIAVATASSRPVMTTTSRGGPRPPSNPPPGRDAIIARPLIPVPSPTAIPSPTPAQPESSSPQSSGPGQLVPLGEFKVTGYSDSPRNGTDGRGITRSGEPTRWGVVAVDPRVIPLGSELVIEGMGGTRFNALDTGGGVVGRWVDVWFPTDWDALQHGVRYLKIYLVEK